MEERKDKAVDLATYLGVTEATVSRYSRGRLPDSMENLSRMADRYSTTIDYLVGRSANRTNGNGLEQEAGFPRMMSFES